MSDGLGVRKVQGLDVRVRWIHLRGDFRLGSRVRLPTTLSTRQKTLRKQTKSLQRRERRKCARSGPEHAQHTRGLDRCYSIRTLQETRLSRGSEFPTDTIGSPYIPRSL